ncbi:HNH endonuclease [Kribbella sp. NBC_01245]|uniref:HNH endonuclease signature motif containing protein n=1 Tax=Kribbella sp. NBC_01245 TaxID=2903578 RepID=UPI002E2D1DCC|nr:hypothetical protein [Kribbella sp. NBC_01245]
MFEGDLGVLAPAELLSVVGEFDVCRDRADVRILEVAVAFADLHPEPRPSGPDGRPGMESVKVYGGKGCPEVAEFAVADLGAALGISSAAAAGLMSDALGLRHRLPRVWARVLAGEAKAWRACRIARASVALSLEAAALVDKAVERIVNRVGPDRLKRIVEGAMWTADPERAQRDAEEAARAHGVWVGRSESGTNTMFVRAATGDIVRLDATIATLAQALKDLGDTDSLDARRAKVIGWLPDPLAVQKLLEAARHLAQSAPPAPSSASSAASGPAAAPDPAAAPSPHLALAGDPLTHAASADRLGSRLAEVKASARATARANAGADADLDLKPPDQPAARSRRGWDLGGGRRDLYVHLSDDTLASGEGVIRVEGIGPMLFSRLREVFGHDQIVVRPVIDLREKVSVDAYEIPHRIRERVVLRDLYCTFPWCNKRATRSIDLDHIKPYDPDGPPGQTSTDNLTPCCRYHHRLKTHGGWTCVRLADGALKWTSPQGARFIVDHTGTRVWSDPPVREGPWRSGA